MILRPAGISPVRYPDFEQTRANYPAYLTIVRLFFEYGTMILRPWGSFQFIGYSDQFVSPLASGIESIRYAGGNPPASGSYPVRTIPRPHGILQLAGPISGIYFACRVSSP